MKKNPILILTLLLLPLWAACEKESVAPSTGPVINQQPTGGLGGNVPCVNKGAVGAQALMLKDKTCEKIKPGRCGDGNVGVGEQCEPPNTKDCDAKCQKVAVGGGGGGGGGDTSPVKILTTAIKDGTVGEVYTSEAISLSGAKGTDKYIWPAEGQVIPDGFELKIGGGTLKEAQLVSKGPATYKKDGYKLTVKACLASDPKVCASREYSFKITDVLTLQAFHMDDPALFCDSEGLSCKEFVFGLNENIFTEPSENDLVKSALIVVRLHAVGGIKDDESFKWQMTVEGKPVPVVTHNEIIMTGLPKGVFLYNPNPEYHYISFSPDAMGKTVKDVKVTVTNASGGQQELVLSKITVPTAAALLNPQKAPVPQTPESPKETVDTACPVLSGLEINGKVHDFGSEIGYVWLSVPIDSHLVVDTNYLGVAKLSSGSGSYTVSDVQYAIDKGEATANAPKISISADGKAVNIGWSAVKMGKPQEVVYDTTQFSLADSSGKCAKGPQQVKIYRILRYPIPKDISLSKVRLLADFRTEFTDGDSYFKFDVYDSGNHLIATTGDQSADGKDPTCFNKHIALTPTVGHESDTIDMIAKVQFLTKDDPSFAQIYDMSSYSRYLRMEVVEDGKVEWYAEDADDYGTYYTSGNKWLTQLTAHFAVNPANGTIWFYGDPPAHPDEAGGGGCDEWKHD